MAALTSTRPGLSQVPTSILYDMLSCLTPEENCVMQRVDRYTSTLLRDPNSVAWQRQCRSLGVSPESMPPGFSFKQVATAPKGVITLAGGNFYLYNYAKDGDYSFCKERWGAGAAEVEPCITISVSSEDSQREGETRRTSYLMDPLKGTWHQEGSHYSRLPCSFPSRIPLRLLMNPDGSYKKEGDKLFLIFKTQPIILTCGSYQDSCDGIPIEGFANGIAKRIQVSESCGFITAEKAKTLVRQISGPWLHSDS